MSTSEWVHLGFSALMAILSLVVAKQASDIREQLANDEIKRRDWIYEHFVSKETCEQHRRGS